MDQYDSVNFGSHNSRLVGQPPGIPAFAPESVLNGYQYKKLGDSEIPWEEDLFPLYY